ncbi:MAG: hypothetical protein AB7R89_28725 [Dehalococcoidia bacterium]
MQTDCIIRSITWTVPSATDAGTEYTVSAPSPTGILSCNCKASEFPKTRGRCWHIKSVRAGLAGKPRVRVTPRSASLAAVA